MNHPETNTALSINYNVNKNLKGKKLHSPFPTPWRRFSYPSLGRQIDVHKLFRILLYRKFASSPFIYLIINMDSGIYFIFGGIIQHFVTYFFTQVVSALTIGNSFSLVVCPFDNAPLFCFSFWVLLSGPTRCSRLILYIICPRPRISHFFKELLLVLLENGLWKHWSGRIRCACWYCNIPDSTPFTVAARKNNFND